MCTKPISVPNPLFARSGFCSEHGQIKEVSSDFSPRDKFIKVPCGKCSECRDTYFNSLLQRAICEARSSYMYFVTLTYDDKHIPIIKLDDDLILYADYSHIQNMIKRFRASGVLDRDFRYLCVNEYGDKFSRPHFHLIFFVSRLQDDDSNTPYFIERILFDNLKVYFSVNVGTRKHPIYEPLFTYCERVTPFGIRSNYWVKYVVDDSLEDYLQLDDESSKVRTIRYLLGYVNTPSKIDNSISDYLFKHQYDKLLCDKVKRLLSNIVRFSKGFGCGFVNGKKYYLPKISVRASSNVLVYSELVDNLPATLDEFRVAYSELYNNLMEWIELDRYSDYNSLKECFRSFTVDDYYYHALMLRYFPNELSSHIRQLYDDSLLPTLSLFMKHLDIYAYSCKRVTTFIPEDSDIYKFLRRGVDEGISAKVPYITFSLKSQRGYVALCKYYRDRVCTFDDIRKMYDSIGVGNYDEWRLKFITSYSTRSADLQHSNLYRNKNNSEIIFDKQKKSLSLLRRVCDKFSIFNVL